MTDTFKRLYWICFILMGIGLITLNPILLTVTFIGWMALLIQEAR
jgi:hypothetical protein